MYSTFIWTQTNAILMISLMLLYLTFVVVDSCYLMIDIETL